MYQADDGVNGVTFHADKDDIGFACIFLGSAGLDAEGVFTFQVAVQTQAVFAYGSQMLAAGNAGHVFTGQCQKSGDTAAYASGSCD